MLPRSSHYRIRLIATVLAAAVLTAGPRAQNIAVEQRTQAIQRALERLPNYGVFDFLAFSVQRGHVTLLGYAYTPALRSDAERALRRVNGVDDLNNLVQVLPASMNDDRIRRATFYNIYADAFLSRYAAGGPRAAQYEALEFGRFPGRQPFGTFPIHIVVDGGRTTLLGVVDNSSDKRLAEMRAREVNGVFAVANELSISAR